MDDDESDSTVLNIRVPQALKERIDATYSDFGYHNRSEFVRSVLRDAIEGSPPPDQTESHSAVSTDTDHTGDNPRQEDQAGEAVDRLLTGSSTSSQSAPTIAVVGCGNVGGQIVDRITRIRTTPINAIVVDTNKQDLLSHQADTKVLIGKPITHGLGAGGDPDIGRRAAENATGVIAEELGEPDVVFVVAGMGGGTGTGASHVIAQVARDCGATVLGMVTQPHRLEPDAVQRSQTGIETLRGTTAGTLVCDITIAAEEILNTGAGEALTALTQLYANVISHLSSALTDESDSRLSISTLQSTFVGGTVGTILFTETDVETDPKEIVINAIENSCYPDDLTHATAGLLCIDASAMRAETAASIRTVFSEFFSEATLHVTQTDTNGLAGHATVYMLLAGIDSAEMAADRQDNRTISADEVAFYDAIVSYSDVDLDEKQVETLAQELQQHVQEMELDWEDRDTARVEIEMEVKSVLSSNDVTLSDHEELVDLLVNHAAPVA